MRGDFDEDEDDDQSEQGIIDGLIARVNSEERSLDDNLFILRNTVGDLRRGFSRAVDPARWVADTQAFIDAIREQARAATKARDAKRAKTTSASEAK